MKKTTTFLLISILTLFCLGTSSTGVSLAYSGIPTFAIVSVVQDKSVTLQTYNFPSNDDFTVTMGAYGTNGIGGIVVTTINSGGRDSFSQTYSIPPTLAGSYRIAIRLQSAKSGYYAYNWFYNKPTTSTTTPSGYTGFPWFTISAVEKGKTVTIQAYNFPTNDSFKVTMGSYGTLGIGGYVVETTTTGSSGSFSKTYAIPSSLAGLGKISIRLQSPTSGYYAYNWFFNNSTSSTTITPTPSPTTSSYSGYPWIKITAVVKNNNVTIQAYNFPSNDTFKVYMGTFGTLGIGGIEVDTTSTGASGTFTKAYSIPASLSGSAKIAIRLQSHASGYYAYNWFFNNTTP